MDTAATAASWSVSGIRRAAHSLLWQLSAGAELGLVVFYGAAFAKSPLLHNAAHDVRHITVQPCR